MAQNKQTSSSTTSSNDSFLKHSRQARKYKDSDDLDKHYQQASKKRLRVDLQEEGGIEEYDEVVVSDGDDSLNNGSSDDSSGDDGSGGDVSGDDTSGDDSDDDGSGDDVTVVGEKKDEVNYEISGEDEFKLFTLDDVPNLFVKNCTLKPKERRKLINDIKEVPTHRKKRADGSHTCKECHGYRFNPKSNNSTTTSSRREVHNCPGKCQHYFLCPTHHLKHHPEASKLISERKKAIRQSNSKRVRKNKSKEAVAKRKKVVCQDQLDDLVKSGSFSKNATPTEFNAGLAKLVNTMTSSYPHQTNITAMTPGLAASILSGQPSATLPTEQSTPSAASASSPSSSTSSTAESPSSKIVTQEPLTPEQEEDAIAKLQEEL